MAFLPALHCPCCVLTRAPARAGSVSSSFTVRQCRGGKELERMEFVTLVLGNDSPVQLRQVRMTQVEWERRGRIRVFLM